MHRFLVALFVVAALSGFGSAIASAAPLSGTAIRDSLNTGSMIEEARLYCYNRYTGRFLHWGPCYGWHRWHHRYWHHWHHWHYWHHHYW